MDERCGKCQTPRQAHRGEPSRHGISGCPFGNEHRNRLMK
ncbi:FT-interacting protein 1-like [Iris pallida]|nr:FT-interacting protein 1-like [Iris pallida]